LNVICSLLALALHRDPQALAANAGPARTAVQPAAVPAPPLPPASSPRTAAPPRTAFVTDARRQDGLHRFHVAARAGSFVPRTELGAGPVVAIEAAYLLPIDGLRDRLWLSLAVGFMSVAQRSQKIVPGRGLDAGFLQRTRIVPIELGAIYDILPPLPGTPGLSAGAGYGLYPTSTEFTAFNSPTTEHGTGHAVFLFGRGSLPLGSGLVFIDVRYAEAHVRLGPLGDVGTSDLSGFAFTAGYSVDL
jgi:hypothetical protein